MDSIKTICLVVSEPFSTTMEITFKDNSSTVVVREEVGISRRMEAILRVI